MIMEENTQGGPLEAQHLVPPNRDKIMVLVQRFSKTGNNKKSQKVGLGNVV